MKQGSRVKVRLRNDLVEPTSIHWHGIRIANGMDGVPGLTQPLVQPGESFEYDFVVPDAGTFWYHTHVHTEEQVDRGLYGPLIVEEKTPLNVDRDVWLIIDDWRLLANNCIDEATFGDRREWARLGRVGNTFTVNGTFNPTFDAIRGERVRIRCVNACNARLLDFDVFSLPMQMIAVDGQTFKEPVPYINRNISIAPGQRTDFVVDIPEDGPDRVVVRLFDSGRALPMATLRMLDGGRKPRPDKLALVPPDLPAPDLARARKVNLLIEGGSQSARFRQGRNMRANRESGQFWQFNGVSGGSYFGFGTGTPLLDAVKGETMVVDVVNRTYFPHALHLHGHHFQVIERDGRAVTGQPWRDVELMEADRQIKIALVADNVGKWLYHCHMVEHASGGMGGWYNVRA